MNFTKLSVLVFLFLPLILVLVYSIIKPAESFLFGRKWLYKNKVEPTEFILDMHRIVNIACLIASIIYAFMYAMS